MIYEVVVLRKLIELFLNLNTISKDLDKALGSYPEAISFQMDITIDLIALEQGLPINKEDDPTLPDYYDSIWECLNDPSEDPDVIYDKIIKLGP